jgi:pimeloyl-ACP methyl ester carboxylesterase
MASTNEKVKKRQKRGVFVWLKRLGIGSILFIILILLSAYAFQAYTTARSKRLYPPPGKLVDIGGYRLHYQSSGSGSPVVVLDSGLGGGIEQWRLVQPEVAKFTRVISYDRAGLGWSDRGPKDRTSRQIVKELYTMLSQAEVPGPYVLVGSSFGGYNVQLFAHEYPDHVAGLVLVDPAIDIPPEEIPESYRRFSENTARYAKWAFLVRFGIVHLVAPQAFENSPPEEREERLSLILRTSYGLTWADEVLNFPISTSQMKGWTLPPDIPLAVLSASRSPQPRAPAEDQLVVVNLRHKLHAAIASQSNNSFQYIVDSGHNIPGDQPASVIDSIRRVVESVRNKTKLIPPPNQ